MPGIPTLVTNADGSMQLTLKQGRVSVNCHLKPGSDFVAAMKAAQVALDLAVEQHRAGRLRDAEAAEGSDSDSNNSDTESEGKPDEEGEGESIETTDDEEEPDSDTASSSLAEFLTEHPEDAAAEEMLAAVEALEEAPEEPLMSDECYSSIDESESSYEEPPRVKPAARASALKAAPVQSIHAKLLNVRVPTKHKKPSRLRKLGPKADKKASSPVSVSRSLWLAPNPSPPRRPDGYESSSSSGSGSSSSCSCAEGCAEGWGCRAAKKEILPAAAASPAEQDSSQISPPTETTTPPEDPSSSSSSVVCVPSA